MASRAPLRSGPLDAYVLHRYDWSESSLILDVFTRERGRLVVVAKGAKRPYSQLRPVLLPFQRLHLTLTRPRGGDEAADIHTLRHAEWAGGGPLLPPPALLAGFYANELLMKLLARDDAHAALFDRYAQTLPALASGHEPLAQAALRGFELSVLRETGVLPDLARVTLTQQPVQPAQAYRLGPEAGVAAAPDDDAPAPLRGADLLALQAALDGGDAAALHRACAPCAMALRGAARALLHYHLGHATLRTREVMHSLRRLADEATAPIPTTHS